MKVVTGDWSDALRAMKPGDKAKFPLAAKASVKSIIAQLEEKLWEINADWSLIGEVDKKKGTFVVQRVS